MGEGPVVFVDGIQYSDDEVKEIKKIVSINYLDEPESGSVKGDSLKKRLVFITTKQ